MGYLFLFLALTLNATANILLKVGAARLGVLDEPNLVGRLFANYHLLAGLSLFALNVVFYVAGAHPVESVGRLSDYDGRRRRHHRDSIYSPPA